LRLTHVLNISADIADMSATTSSEIHWPECRHCAERYRYRYRWCNRWQAFCRSFSNFIRPFSDFFVTLFEPFSNSSSIVFDTKKTQHSNLRQSLFFKVIVITACSTINSFLSLFCFFLSFTFGQSSVSSDDFFHSCQQLQNQKIIIPYKKIKKQKNRKTDRQTYRQTQQENSITISLVTIRKRWFLISCENIIKW
jgi:hypothetical protein